ncbi:hypothetical protein A3Q37_06787 [Streptomyces sp. PTY087I2]|nr:hypothetical protein A3Q37_06787 [Streptomyces sp. PTY087I2]
MTSWAGRRNHQVDGHGSTWPGVRPMRHSFASASRPGICTADTLAKESHVTAKSAAAAARATVYGYPRQGQNRELKKAIEGY